MAFRSSFFPPAAVHYREGCMYTYIYTHIYVYVWSYIYIYICLRRANTTLHVDCSWVSDNPTYGRQAGCSSV